MATFTGGPLYSAPATRTGSAASAVEGRVAATVMATTPRQAALVISHAFHSVNDRICPRRIGSSTR